MRSANVYFKGILAGRLTQDGSICRFAYDRTYLARADARAISSSLPLSAEPYQSGELFPFFRGLIPEGWLFDLNARALKIDPADEFGMLLHTGRDCIGAVTVVNLEEE
jgi:serine/threonine-protein kinase HipA